mmetsp:Transcript_25565/g.42220  ORF Transcript_25565/g.42220 Transcript_25565/m.42220 type:complete len:82 (-) Transcript_25565:668-913(-)
MDVGNRTVPSRDVLDILSLEEKSWMGVAPPLMLAMREPDGWVLSSLMRRFFLRDGPDMMMEDDDGCCDDDDNGMNEESSSS